MNAMNTMREVRITLAITVVAFVAIFERTKFDTQSWVQAQEIGGKESATRKANSEANETTDRESPPYRGLDANLYMQISAEYRACCLQAFRLARLALAEKVAARSKQLARQIDRPSNSEHTDSTKPPAVILDLDETVFDNRAFQTKQLREGWAYSQKYWSKFEQEGGEQVVAIPGSIDFLSYAKSIGVQPVFITNRNSNAQEKTMAILRQFGIDVPNELLLCADAKTGSSKDSRRASVRERYDVLLLIGDNLRDFDDSFRYDGSSGAAAGIEARKGLVDSYGDRWGSEWIVLPNPAYGEWNKALGRGEADVELLDPVLNTAH